MVKYPTRPRFNSFLFPILASMERKNSEMCPWLLRGEGDPGHTWNKEKANLIMVSFIQRWRGDISCLLNINKRTQNQMAMREEQRKWATKSSSVSIHYSEEGGLTRYIWVRGNVIRLTRVSVATFSLALKKKLLIFNISGNNLRRTKCTLCWDILGRVIKKWRAYFIHTVTKPSTLPKTRIWNKFWNKNYSSVLQKGIRSTSA